MVVAHGPASQKRTEFGLNCGTFCVPLSGEHRDFLVCRSMQEICQLQYQINPRMFELEIPPKFCALLTGGSSDRQSQTSRFSIVYTGLETRQLQNQNTFSESLAKS